MTTWNAPSRSSRWRSGCTPIAWGMPMPEGKMTADAIAQMLGRVLVVDLPADEEAP